MWVSWEILVTGLYVVTRTLQAKVYVCELYLLCRSSQ